MSSIVPKSQVSLKQRVFYSMGLSDYDTAEKWFSMMDKSQSIWKTTQSALIDFYIEAGKIERAEKMAFDNPDILFGIAEKVLELSAKVEQAPEPVDETTQEEIQLRFSYSSTGEGTIDRKRAGKDLFNFYMDKGELSMAEEMLVHFDEEPRECNANLIVEMYLRERRGDDANRVREQYIKNPDEELDYQLARHL